MTMNRLGVVLALGGWAVVAGQAGSTFLEPAVAPSYGWLASLVPSSLDGTLDANGTRLEAGGSSIDNAQNSRVADQEEPRLNLNGNGNIVNNTMPSWIPTRGTCCRGIWSAKWNGAENLENLTAILSATAPLLLQRINQGSCPFGHALPGDVTWRGSIPKELDGIVAPQTAWTVVSVIYSYMPYFVAAAAIVDLLVRRGTRQLQVAVWLGLLVLVNEAIIKKMISQPRPGTMLQMRDSSGLYVGSCVQSCGMPSSHSALAMGWFVLLLCDAVQRVHPEAIHMKNVASSKANSSKLCSERISDCHNSLRKAAKENTSGCKKLFSVLGLIVLTPWVPNDALTLDEFMAYIVFWSVVFLPVPFSRLELYDHTHEQVLTGCIVGSLIAIVWWRFVRLLQGCFDRKWAGQDLLRIGRVMEDGRRRFRLLTHDYPRPIFMHEDEIEALDHEWEVKVNHGKQGIIKIKDCKEVVPEGMQPRYGRIKFRSRHRVSAPILNAPFGQPSERTGKLVVKEIQWYRQAGDRRDVYEEWIRRESDGPTPPHHQAEEGAAVMYQRRSFPTATALQALEAATPST